MQTDPIETPRVVEISSQTEEVPVQVSPLIETSFAEIQTEEEEKDFNLNEPIPPKEESNQSSKAEPIEFSTQTEWVEETKPTPEDFSA